MKEDHSSVSSTLVGEKRQGHHDSKQLPWKAPVLIDLDVEHTHGKTVINTVEGTTRFGKDEQGS